jgi:ADP-heptose:LPS heptosyltransferase
MAEQARIAVIANDALGNYVVSTPLLQMLRENFPGARLHYFSGPRVEEFWSRDQNIDRGFAFPHDGFPAAYRHDPYDLVVNIEQGPGAKMLTGVLGSGGALVCGPCSVEGRDLPYADDSRGALWRDREWIAPGLEKRYPFLQSSFIGEIFCRLCYLEGQVPGYQVPTDRPPIELPQVLIATAASLPEKLWPVEKWIQAIAELRRRGYTVGLIGAKPAHQQQFWQGGSGEEEIVATGMVEDLRGRLTLPQVAGGLRGAALVLTLDNGILHLAVAAGTRTIGLYRHGIHRLWAPPAKNLRVVTPGEGGAVSEIAVDEVLREV